MKPNIIYLHGFNSGPNPHSEKNKLLGTFGTLHCLKYDSFAPHEDVYSELLTQIESIEDPVFVGTSLGAYWAQVFGEAWCAPSVLINPLMNPAKYFHARRGERILNTKTSRSQTVTEEMAKSYIGQSLVTYLDDAAIAPLVLLDTEDEVLDSYRTAETFRSLGDDATFMIHMFEGGNHRFAHMKEAILPIQKYINLAQTTGDCNT